MTTAPEMPTSATPAPPTETTAAPAEASQDNDKPAETSPVPPSPSKSFAAAARREQALQRQREAYRAERAAVEAQRAEIAREKAELEAKYGKRPANPIEALKMHGFDYKAATEFALNDNQPTAEQIARATAARVEELEAQRQRESQEAAARAQQAAAQEVEATITDYKGEIGDFITENKGAYELINFHNAQELVYATVELHYEKTKRVLSIREASDLVEKHLEKQAEKLLETGKLKSRVAPKTSEEPPKPGQSPAQQPRRTLNNGLTPSTPTLVSSKEIEDDRMKRALAALGG